MRTLPILILVAVCVLGRGEAQELRVVLPLKEFINTGAAAEAALVIAQGDWGRAHCPKHLTESMWLSPLGMAFVKALRALDPGKFQEHLAANAAGLAREIKDWANEAPEQARLLKHDACQGIWITFLTIEGLASKAYWAAGWQPEK